MRVETSETGLVPLWRRPRRAPMPLCYKTARYEPGSGLLPDMESAVPRFWYLASTTVRNQCLFFKLPRLWYFVITDWTDWDSWAGQMLSRAHAHPFFPTSPGSLSGGLAKLIRSYSNMSLKNGKEIHAPLQCHCSRRPGWQVWKNK